MVPARKIPTTIAASRTPVAVAVETLLGELAQDPAVKGTSWQVARASPEA